MSILPDAKSLPKKNVMEYVSDRIKAAAGAGYASTRCWINTSEKAKVETALAEAGYEVEEDKLEDRRVQLLILW